MPCAAWQDDLAGWAVAQIWPEREAQLEQHLAACEVCRAEAASLLAVAAVSLAADPDRTHHVAEAVAADLEQPPAELAEQIVATISAERRARWRVRAGLAALAGAAAVVVAVAAVVVLQRDGARAPLLGQEVVFAVAPPGAAADAVVADDDTGGSLVQLTATGLDPGVTYALWLSPPAGTWDDRVAAGTFRPDGDGSVDVRLRCALPADAYGRVWATTPDGQIALDTQ